MNYEELISKFTKLGIEHLTQAELEYVIYFQYSRIRVLEREANTAVRLTGVSAGEINISNVSVTR